MAHFLKIMKIMKNIEGTLCFSPKFSALGRKKHRGDTMFLTKKTKKIGLRPKNVAKQGGDQWLRGVNVLEYD